MRAQRRELDALKAVRYQFHDTLGRLVEAQARRVRELDQLTIQLSERMRSWPGCNVKRPGRYRGKRWPCSSSAWIRSIAR